jgi:hypothetical protein
LLLDITGAYDVGMENNTATTNLSNGNGNAVIHATKKEYFGRWMLVPACMTSRQLSNSTRWYYYTPTTQEVTCKRCANKAGK